MVSCSSETLGSAWSNDNIQFSIEAEPLVPDSGALATRATKQTSINSFKVYAYDASGNSVINGATYTKNSSGTWTSTTSTEWPSGNVTFYAFSPGDNSAVSFSTSTKQLTYTAPTAQASQQDVLYAYTVSSRPTNNTITLAFSHANAAFSVNARLASGCTASVNVSGVSLANVMPTNTLTLTDGSAAASGSNITSTLAVSAKTLTTSNQAISSSPLIIPPQSVTAWSGSSSLANTYLAVTCKISQDDKYIVGSSTTTGTVYVPMSKALTKGQDNSVNLVFGNEENGARCYGRDANGNRITYSTSSTSTPKTITEITSADLGKVICTDGTIYNTVAEATAAGKTAAAMVAYVSGTGHGLAIALKDVDSGGTVWGGDDWYDAGDIFGYTPVVSGYEWKIPTPNDFDHMFASFGGTAYSDARHSDNQSWSYGNFRSKLTSCGGDDMTDEYWADSPSPGGGYYTAAYSFYASTWYYASWSIDNIRIRLCFEF